MSEKKFIIATLGCPKNEVDSDIICGKLINDSFTPTNSPTEADFLIVNTCAFIADAVEENLRFIRKLAKIKKKSNAKLIVTGCLVERFKNNLFNVIPEIDASIPTNNINEFGEILRNLDSAKTNIQFDSQTYIYKQRNEGSFFRNRSYAYIKVAEGCNRPCSFCIIPKIRGKFRSRLIDDIVDEAKFLIDQGFKEIILVAQDLSNYGQDIYKRTALDTLLVELDKLPGQFWIRLLYLYPLGINDRLLETMSSLEKVANYIDIPFQHSSRKMLQIMKRPTGKFEPRRLVEKIRSVRDDFHIRTTFIVGHPGETDEDFNDLCRFVKEYKLTNVGVFCYSDEPESESFRMSDKVSKSVAKKRYHELMSIQKMVSAEILSQMKGKEITVLAETKRNGGAGVGRAYFQAPEIDGLTFIEAKNISLNKFIKCKITQTGDYDIWVKPSRLCESG
ncbi:MAG: 30S ribosomal protein S12 methylthiotransferase RimO [Deltaproteobacteria bacterium]|nr:30S ribosomal protein S12 methylthiotransferase RimO [Deltaproteobacteria bacterium]